jgi:hypothetical protein
MDVNYDPKMSPSYHFIQKQCCKQPIPVASLSKARVCDISLVGIDDSHAAGGIACVTLVSVVCCQEEITESG